MRIGWVWKLWWWVSLKTSKKTRSLEVLELNVFKYLLMILSKLFGSNCRAKILEKFFIEHSVS